MSIIAHFTTFDYIVALITGAICLCVFFLSREKFPKLFGLEYRALKRFLLVLSLFFIANFLIYYNEVFMSWTYFKLVLLVGFDILLVTAVYCGIRLNALSSMKLVLRFLVLAGAMYIILWAITYFFDFSENPVLKSILVLIADAVFCAVSSGILIICCAHQIRYNEDFWERRYLVIIDIMLIVYVCLLYCADLYTQLSRAYVSPTVPYPYFLDPVILIFIVINGVTMIYLILGMQHIKEKERDLPEPAGEHAGSAEALDIICEANHVSSREREVIELILQGDNNAEIADKLNISVYTVKRHINNIFRKLEVKSRFELLYKISSEK